MPVATVDNMPAATDGFVSLKVELTDTNGVGVTQTLTDLYGVVTGRRVGVGPGAPHGAWPLVAAICGTRGYRGPTPRSV